MSADRAGSDAKTSPSKHMNPAGEGFAEFREALSGLREEIRTQQRRTLQPPREAGRGPEWGTLFDELRKRVGTLGMSEREPDVDEFGMQTDYLARQRPLFDFLFEKYWRVEIIDEQRLAEDRPVVFVANRSGVLPWDGMMLAHAVARVHGAENRPRFLVDDAVLALPFAQAQLARIGGVRACRENLDLLLGREHSVIAFPGDIRGTSRSYRERYQVAPFRDTSAVLAAGLAGCAVIPVGIVGADDATPRLGDMAILSKLSSRDLGIPKLPITPTFPLMGPLGLLPLPAKWIISVGEPVALDGTRLENDREASRELNDELRSQVQRLVEQGLDARSSTWA